MSTEAKKGALGFKADTPAERFFNGLIAENPTLVLMIGMCPTLAVTSSAINGLGMGLATTFVLALSNAVISALRKTIPSTVRIPSFIVVIASFVTLVELLMKAYVPALNAALGVYIPLIACIGLVREFIGAGTAFDVQILGEGTVVPGAVGAFLSQYQPVSIFIQQAGAFFVLAFLIAIMNKIKMNMAAKGKDTSKFGQGCCSSAEEAAADKIMAEKSAGKEAKG